MGQITFQKRKNDRLTDDQSVYPFSVIQASDRINDSTMTDQLFFENVARYKDTVAIVLSTITFNTAGDKDELPPFFRHLC